MTTWQRRFDVIALVLAAAGVVQLVAAAVIGFSFPGAEDVEQRLQLVTRQTGPFPALLLLLGLLIVVLPEAVAGRVDPKPSGISRAVLALGALGGLLVAFVGITGMLLAATSSDPGGVRLGRFLLDVVTVALAATAVWLAFVEGEGRRRPSAQQLDPKA